MKNDECCGHSAHNWSSYQRVGSLSRIGLMAENKGTIYESMKALLTSRGHFFILGDITNGSIAAKVHDYISLSISEDGIQKKVG